MPTILRQGPYRLFFYSGDGDEPVHVHVHVERDNHVAKFWLDPVWLQRSGGFRQPEITRVSEMIEEHRTEIVEAWNDYFDS